MFTQIHQTPHDQREQHDAQAPLKEPLGGHSYRQQQRASNHEEQVTVYRHQHGIDRTRDRWRVIVNVVRAYRGVDEDNQHASQYTQDVQIRYATLQLGLGHHGMTGFDSMSATAWAAIPSPRPV